ncbi:hypothetical protein [Bacillus thermotolerans]|uniref:Uncharacterized protein n=1 Tax=Bacillus thermotolerans TaxID=1221996 RepID=A0A0F5I5B1_BACTR|nr:hypothetical protein [Bacillus thermotolerans]KKB35629.1 hypothetical protein QY97_01578 [Bacillus thermotolerans]KKB40460.1 hypothetical protein QY95_01455 [Bacillus thermotolerans]
MKDKHEHFPFLPDTQFEGRDQVYLDIDRMINEGMSGGSVHMREDSLTANIEEVIPFMDETPPNQQ